MPYSVILGYSQLPSWTGSPTARSIPVLVTTVTMGRVIQYRPDLIQATPGPAPIYFVGI